jgi:hypothetical protein
MKKIQYRVTHALGASDEGDIRDAYLLLSEDGNQGLIYHPKSSEDRYECASLEFATRGHDGVWRAARKDMAWVNIDSQRKISQLIQNLGKIEYRKLKTKTLRRIVK